MKPIQIALIALIAVGIAVVVSLYGSTSKYVTFQSAEELAVEHPGKSFHVVAKFEKDSPMVYDAEKNPDYCEFTATDTVGVTKKVIYRKGKPTDIDKAERIVLIGNFKNGMFEAESYLTKCPSKYNDEVDPKNM